MICTNHEDIHRLKLNGKEIILIGTAHVSKESAELVENVIAEENPDVVCIELCKSRYQAIIQKDKWQETNIVKVIREKRSSLLLSQLLLVSFQKKIAKKFNIQPGEEMLRAIKKADELGSQIVLADRDVRVTLIRAWRMMSFWNKLKVIPETLVALLVTEEITEKEIEMLKKHDMLELALKTMGETMPYLKNILIDERDQYLAHSIFHAPGTKIVAVVGAGHVPGIIKHMGKEVDVEVLNQIPPPSIWSKFGGWIFSAVIIALFIAGFFYSGSQASLSMIKWWILITATCSAIGAIMLLAHPLTIVASALAAPITTLHPLLAAGWIAGLAEASIRKPQVRDFLELSEDITTFRGFFKNRIIRLLLLVAIVNLTTSIGTFVAIPVILRFL